jgi:hypothetical protein
MMEMRTSRSRGEMRNPEDMANLTSCAQKKADSASPILSAARTRRQNVGRICRPVC